MYGVSLVLTTRMRSRGVHQGRLGAKMRPPVHRHSPPIRRPQTKVTVYCAVILVALASYLNGLHGEFVHDDIPAITQNKDVLCLNPVFEVFRNDFWGTPMSDVNSHKSYRPLTTLTFRANYLLWGLQPVWFHSTNLFLHTVASLLFTKICLDVVKLQSGFVCFAGLIFAAHPIHTEVVAGIVGRADVLACVFFLLSFLAYHGRGSEPLDNVWLSIILGGVSMLAKETGITVLLLNLLYDLYRSWNAIRRAVLEVRWNEDTLHFSRRAAKILMSLSLLLILRLAVLQGSLPKFSNQDNPAAFHPHRHVRFLTFCYLAAFNFWLLLCPVTLSHDWQMGSVPLVTSLADTRNLGTFLFFVCCLIIAYRGLADFEQQRHSPLVLGCLLLVLPFLPAANLAVTVGFVVAERVLYIPSLGFVLLVVYGAQLLWAAFLRQRSLLLCVGLVVLLVLCTRTVVRNRDWSCRETLIMAGLKALPHNAKMHYNFANFQRDSSSLELATSHYKEALKLWPTYASAHNNLGTLMTGTDEAESHFLAAIRYSPNHVNAHYNLGQVYRKENRSEEAIRMLERCIRLDPAYTPAYLLLARLYSNRGVHEAVGQLLRHVATLEPESSDHMAEYATWIRDKGRSWEALNYFYKALAFSSTHQISLLGAAKILRSKGQWPRIHQLMIRYHIISRDHKGGVVYTGDLYIRKWRDETMPHNRGGSDSTSSARPSSGSQQNSLSQCAKKSWQPPRPATSENFRPKSPRRKIRPWRRLPVNRTLVLRPGNIPETSCSLEGDLSTTRQDEGTRSTGTAAFNQGYHYSYWSQEQLYIPGETAVHLPVDAPISLSGERDLCCMGGFPDATTDDEFSPDFMTG